MLSSSIAIRLILASSLLLGLVAINPPTHAQPTREQAQPSSVTAIDLTAKRVKVEGKWSIKVRHWTKPFKRGTQARIDRCKATLWWGSKPRPRAVNPTWLAGHDYCGFWRWDKWLPVGSQFKIKNPRGTIRTYVVYDRAFINRKRGSSAGLIHRDITLQTCRGAGTTFVYARLVR